MFYIFYMCVFNLFLFKGSSKCGSPPCCPVQELIIVLSLIYCYMYYFWTNKDEMRSWEISPWCRDRKRKRCHLPMIRLRLSIIILNMADSSSARFSFTVSLTTPFFMSIIIASADTIWRQRTTVRFALPRNVVIFEAYEFTLRGEYALRSSPQSLRKMSRQSLQRSRRRLQRQQR